MSSSSSDPVPMEIGAVSKGKSKGKGSKGNGKGNGKQILTRGATPGTTTTPTTTSMLPFYEYCGKRGHTIDNFWSHPNFYNSDPNEYYDSNGVRWVTGAMSNGTRWIPVPAPTAATCSSSTPTGINSILAGPTAHQQQ